MTTAAPSHHHLSAADIEALLTQQSSSQRLDLVRELAWDMKTPGLSTDKQQTLQEILQIIAASVIGEVKAVVAEELKDFQGLPPDVALLMARDIHAVSLPILEYSMVFGDDDLLDIVATADMRKQQAIAKRPTVSKQVSEALVTQGHRDVIVTLTANKKAEISEDTLNVILDKFPDDDKIAENMTFREKLPLPFVERLLVAVADNLKEHLLAHHPVPPAVARQIIQQSREKTLLRLVEGSSSSGQMQRLVKQLYANHRLTDTLMIRAACCGEMRFFEYALAQRTKLPLQNIQKVLYEGGRQGLQLLMQKSALPDSYLSLLQLCLVVYQETLKHNEPADSERFSRLVIERMITSSVNLAQDSMEYMLRKLTAQTAAS